MLYEIYATLNLTMIEPDILTGRLGNRMFQIAYLYSQVKDGVIPDWYLQDPKHFEKYKKEIKALFSEGIASLPYVAIHLRRGGNPINPKEPKYSENPFYVDLSKTDYYKRAMDYFPSKIFLVFSDDMEFAKAFFKGDRFIFDHSSNAVDVLNHMAACQGIIMGNSSLSWWAAYLGKEGKKVVAPGHSLWYADGNKERTILPSDWIEINK